MGQSTFTTNPDDRLPPAPTPDQAARVYGSHSRPPSPPQTPPPQSPTRRRSSSSSSSSSRIDLSKVPASLVPGPPGYYNFQQTGRQETFTPPASPPVSPPPTRTIPRKPVRTVKAPVGRNLAPYVPVRASTTGSARTTGPPQFQPSTSGTPSQDALERLRALHAQASFAFQDPATADGNRRQLELLQDYYAQLAKLAGEACGQGGNGGSSASQRATHQGMQDKVDAMRRTRSDPTGRRGAPAKSSQELVFDAVMALKSASDDLATWTARVERAVGDATGVRGLGHDQGDAWGWIYRQLVAGHAIEDGPLNALAAIRQLRHRLEGRFGAANSVQSSGSGPRLGASSRQ